MELSRRTLFEEILASGGVATLLASQALHRQLHQPRLASPTTGLTTSGERSSIRSIHRRALPGAGEKKRIPFPDKEVRYLYYTDGTLAYTDQIKKEQLVDFPGDVTVNIILSQFRLSQEDQDALRICGRRSCVSIACRPSRL